MDLTTLSIIIGIIVNIIATVGGFFKYGLKMEHRLTEVETLLKIMARKHFNEDNDIMSTTLHNKPIRSVK